MRTIGPGLSRLGLVHQSLLGLAEAEAAKRGHNPAVLATEVRQAAKAVAGWLRTPQYPACGAAVNGGRVN